MACAFGGPPAFAVGAVGTCAWPYTLKTLLDFKNTLTDAYILSGSTIDLGASGLLTATCTVAYNTSAAPNRNGTFPTTASCQFDANNAQAVNASGCGVLKYSQVQWDSFQVPIVFFPLSTTLAVQQSFLVGGASNCTTCPPGSNCTNAGTTQPAPCPTVSMCCGVCHCAPN